MHLNEGQLRASQDHEISEEAARHLAECPLCQQKLAEIQTRQAQVSQALSFLADAADRKNELIPSAAYELTHLKARVKEKEHRMKNIFKILKNRLVWGSATIALVVTTFLSVPTMRAAAAQLLALFRVQQVAALPLDPSGMDKFTGDENLSNRLSQVISDSVVETQKAGDPRVVGSAEEAGEQTGFQVRLPQSESDAPVIYVHDPMAYQITINRAKAQQFIDETGRTDLVLPENVDGQQINVEIPAGASAAFGECPAPDEEIKPADPDDPGSAARLYPDCVMLIQYASPTVSAPDDLDIDQLVQLGLELTGMSPEEAEQVRSSIDWTSTLVIPIPRNASTYEQVEVDGATATLVQQTSHDPHYMLVWVKDGLIHSVSGAGTDTSRALEIANSLQ